MADFGTPDEARRLQAQRAAEYRSDLQRQIDEQRHRSEAQRAHERALADAVRSAEDARARDLARDALEAARLSREQTETEWRRSAAARDEQRRAQAQADADRAARDAEIDRRMCVVPCACTRATWGLMVLVAAQVGGRAAACARGAAAAGRRAV
jgi:hypothetical protein